MTDGLVELVTHLKDGFDKMEMQPINKCPECKSGIVWGLVDPNGNKRELKEHRQVLKIKGSYTYWSKDEPTGKSISVCADCHKEPTPLYIAVEEPKKMEVGNLGF